MTQLLPTHPIVAVATAPGTAGIAVIRLSGEGAIALADLAWRGTRPLSTLKGYSAAYGSLTDARGEIIDEAVATVFRAPHSFTSQDTVEFSVHGSQWIQRQVVERLIELGAQPAGPGEFTQRAFLSGRIDLAQAEGVADLIASSSRAAHRLAMSQARGTFSSGLEILRKQLIDFAAMLELELDFGEEEVEFADRTQLLQLATTVKNTVDRLADSFRTGKAFREGVPVVIAGIPNAGKSTLLNRLLHDDKAIVSSIPGTTRDIVEDTREIGGILFRFADTAGLRDTTDTVEAIGVERARTRLSTAAIVIWLIDPTAPLPPQLDLLTAHLSAHPGTHLATPLPASPANIYPTPHSSTTRHIITSPSNTHATDYTTSPSNTHAIDYTTSLSDTYQVAGNHPIYSAETHTTSPTTVSHIAISPLNAHHSTESVTNTPPDTYPTDNVSTLPVDTYPQHIIPLISKTDIADFGLIAATQRALLSLNPHYTQPNPDPESSQNSSQTPTPESILTVLEQRLVNLATAEHNPDTELIVTNARHHTALLNTSAALSRAIGALTTGLSADFVAQDVREATHHLATITGTDAAITPDTLLQTIFSRFCIGK